MAEYKSHIVFSLHPMDTTSTTEISSLESERKFYLENLQLHCTEEGIQIEIKNGREFLKNNDILIFKQLAFRIEIQDKNFSQIGVLSQKSHHLEESFPDPFDFLYENSSVSNYESYQLPQLFQEDHYMNNNKISIFDEDLLDKEKK